MDDRRMVTLREAVWGGTAGLLQKLPPDLEAVAYRAAVVHWFDPPILEALAKGDGVAPSTGTELFGAFTQLPFVEEYPGPARLCFQNLTREAMTDRLWHDDAPLYRTVSARVADHFWGRADSEDGLTPEETVELAYHQLLVDETDGISLIESLFWSHTLPPASLEALLRAVAEHVEHGRVSEETVIRSRLWSLWLAADRRHHAQIREIGAELMNGVNVPPEIRAEAASCVAESLLQTGERDGAGELYTKVINDASTQPDRRLAALAGLGDISLDRGQPEEADTYYQRALTVAVAVALSDTEGDVDGHTEEHLAAAVASVHFTDPNAWERLRELVDLQEIEAVSTLRPDEGPESSEHLWCLPEDTGVDEPSPEEPQDWRVLAPVQVMGDIWLKRGDVRHRQGAYDDAVAAYRLAWRLFEDVDDAEGASIAIGVLQGMGVERGDSAMASAWINSQRLMLEHAEKTGDAAVMLQVVTHLASSYDRLDEVELARAHYERAAKLAQDSGNVVAEASALEGLANLLIRTGQADEARDPLQRAMSLYQRAELREGAIRMVLTSGDLERVRHNPDDAAEAYREALRKSVEADIPGGRFDAHMGLASSFLERGSLEMAVEQFEQAAEDARRVGAPQRMQALIQAYDLQARLGRETAAENLRREAFELADKFHLRAMLAALLIDTGCANLDLGTDEVAEECFQGAEQVFSELRQPGGQADALRGRARVAERRGNQQEAADLAGEAVARARESGDIPCVLNALVDAALMLAGAGRNREARAALAEAAELDPEGHGLLEPFQEAKARLDVAPG